MNVAAAFSGEAYNMICSLLGANWYAVAATLVLAAGVVIHFVYAVLLTLQNRKARGNDRYAINARPKGVEWASQNMLVLGIIIILFMVLHFIAKSGVCKINIDSDIRLAMTANIRKYMAEHPEAFDPRAYLKPAREAVKNMVQRKIRNVLGSSNKI